MVDIKEHPCMKALYLQFTKIRMEPKKLAPLIESRKQELSGSESAGIHGDYGDEDQNYIAEEKDD